MRIAETAVFTFDELGDDAKERAREWFRQGFESDELADYDDWTECARILGIEFDTHAVRLMGGGVRHDPSIWWSLSYSQGDGASFEGRYRYAKGAARKIRQHAPEDKTLAGIADALQEAQRRNFYQLEARISRGAGSNFYSHSGTMAVDVFDARDQYRDLGDDEETVKDAMRGFADWIYGQLQAQDEYLRSDEAVDESIRANGYEFTGEGAHTDA